MKEWYAVHTKPSREAVAEWHLRNQGFETFLPRYRKTRRHARRVDVVAAPLFPRYMFARIDVETERWRSVYGTIGVAGMVTANNLPLPVNPRIIEAIRAREGDDGLVELDAPTFVQGQAIRIAAGPLAAVEGLFHEALDKDRVVLLLNLLGGPIRVEVASALVEAAA